MTYQPEHLYLLGHGENSIYQIVRELADERVTPIIADIRDPRQLEVIFRRYRPQQLFHAAAHKHVPLMERQVTEAFLNNVWGSHCLLETALAEGVSKMVLISTDKAAEPSSLMGLSKYFAELVARRFKLQTPHGLLSVVRFGNVIGSRGSVIPLFEQQIAAGGPLTITDFAMTRYFMTIPEAVQLVLQASVLEHDAGNFILDMGEPIRILDLARNMIRLSGYQADELEVRATGMRPGEKIHETLVWADETLHPTACPQILAAEAAPERIHAHLALLERILTELEQRPDQFEAFFAAEVRPAFAGLQAQGNTKDPATSGLP